jgi:hypothetical protein
MKAIAGAASLRAGTASVDSIVSTLLLLLLLLFILDPAAMRQGVIVKRSPRASSHGHPRRKHGGCFVGSS